MAWFKKQGFFLQDFSKLFVYLYGFTILLLPFEKYKVLIMWCLIAQIKSPKAIITMIKTLVIGNALFFKNQEKVPTFLYIVCFRTLL